jgi:hypothetical protein
VREPILESQLALAAVARLPARDARAANVIRDLARRFGIPNVTAVTRRLR